MPDLEQSPSPTFSARSEPVRPFFAQQMHAGGEGAALQKIGAEGTAAVAQAADMQSENEQRQVLLQGAQIRQKYSQQMDAAVTSGAPLQPIQDSMTAELAGLSDNVETTKGHYAAKLVQANTGAEMGDRMWRAGLVQQGTIAKTQGSALVSTLAQTVDHDPSQQGAANTAIDQFLATFHGKTDSATLDVLGLSLKQDVASAKAMSIARSNPNLILKGGYSDPFLSKTGLEQATGQAQYQQRAGMDQQDLVLRTQELQRAEANNSALDKAFQGLTTGKMLATDAINIPGLDATGKDAVLRYAQALRVAPPSGPISDPSTLVNWNKMLGTGEVNQDNIHAVGGALMASGKLTLPDYLKGVDDMKKIQGSDPVAIAIKQATTRADTYISSWADDPAMAPGLTVKFSRALEAAVGADKDNNRDPFKFSLNPDYEGSPLNPKRMDSFMQAGAGGLALPPPPKVGALQVHGGKSYKYLGGPPGLPTSWQAQ